MKGEGVEKERERKREIERARKRERENERVGPRSQSEYTGTIKFEFACEIKDKIK